jgi:glycoprotein endo-alpha-1,2-mannosidase
MNRFIIALLFFCTSIAFGQVDFDALQKRAELRYNNMPRKVLAFYYPWYGSAERHNGKWPHWGSVNFEKHDIKTSTNYPQLGPYDSHDKAVIAKQCAWAKHAGVDGFISSWWDKRSYSDRAMPLILDACAKEGLEVSIYYEAIKKPQGPESVAGSLLYALNKYANHPAFMKVDGRPVVFVYVRAMNDIDLFQWLEAITLVNQRYKPGVVFIADQLSHKSARIFDGIHTYNTAGQLRGLSVSETTKWAKDSYPQWVGMAKDAGRISTLTIIPGYDDTKIREPGLKIERFNGELYRAQWEAATKAGPDWILITSWNEWHEGSEIEPSLEDGERYLELTTEFAKAFKNSTKKPYKPKPSLFTAEEKSQLKKKLTQHTIGVLPNADSAAVWWLIDMGVKFRFLTWEEVVSPNFDAKHYALLLYASDESYQRTVKSEGDVDKAIQQYLASGGFLLTLPSSPIPFYYDENKRAVNMASRLGLPIGMGFESPPGDKSSFFVKAKGMLPHWPQHTPFPKTGDQRWRPWTSRHMTGDADISILMCMECSDISSNAVVYAQYTSGPLQGGKVLYAWFGLLNMPNSEALIFDLFDYAAETLK